MAPALAARLAGSHVHLGLIGRRTLARRPDVWVYALAVVGATLLLEAALSAGATASSEHKASWLAAWSEWMLMVLAMMLPVIAAEARQVAMRSLWRRRHRAILGYLSGYVSVWALVGLAIVGALHGAHQPHPPAGVTVVALLCAAIWQTSRHRVRIMRRCGSVQIGAAQGLAADRDCAVAGWRAGLLCALTCGPVMLVMAIGHDFGALMAGLLVLLLTERARGPNPSRRAGRPLEAWCLVGYAALLTVIAPG